MGGWRQRLEENLRKELEETAQARQAAQERAAEIGDALALERARVAAAARREQEAALNRTRLEARSPPPHPTLPQTPNPPLLLYPLRLPARSREPAAPGWKRDQSPPPFPAPKRSPK